MLFLPLEKRYIKSSLDKVYNKVKESFKDVYFVMLPCDELGCSYHPSLKSHEEMSKKLINILKEGE